MSIEPGLKLGPYEVLSPLGAGGMGEVYKAKDTRLDRSVALKVLPSELARDPSRRARLEREAKAISKLNHAHICTLHDIGAHDGIDYLVMEYLEGETLADRLKRGALPLEQVLELARQMASALAAAHEHGIVHRDLKPSNVMLTKSGVKLLDFGLAKWEEKGGSVAPTAEKPLTQEGSLLGTIAYMAPEQLEGKEADARSDIYAFGAVLYEMVTGERAFDTGRRRTLAPARLEEIVSTALARSPEERWQSARDMGRLLSMVNSAGAVVTAAKPRRHFERLAWIALAGLAVFFAWWAHKPAPAEVTRTVVRLPAGEEFRGAEFPDFAISPDGRRLVFATRPSTQTAPTLYLREIGRFEPRALPDAGSGQQPVFSPDGESVAFVTVPQPSIVKMSLDDGVVTKVCDVPTTVSGLAWTENGDILFGTIDRGIFRVAADRGAPEALTFLGQGESGHWNPKPLPRGRGLLFTVSRSGAYHAGLSKPKEREHVVLFEGYGAAYVEAGYILFGHRWSSELSAVPFDIDRLEVHGPPVAIEAGVHVSHNSRPQFQVGQNGTLVYASGKASTSSVVWVSRDGAVETVHAFDGRYHSLHLAPDGGRFVADDVVGQNASIWGHDLVLGTRFLVASGAGLHVPRFTLDGAEVVFAALDGDLFMKSADGTGEARPLLAKENVMFPLSWSPDGKLLAFTEMHPDTGADLWILPRGGEPYPFVQTRANEPAGAFSPDGRFLAYQSDESGRPEIYIQPFPGPGARVLVSTAGGKEPVWSRSGSELYYRQGTAMVEIPIATEPVLRVGKAEVLFDGPYQADRAGHSAYDVSPDGKRFLMIRNEGAGEIDLHVVFNLGEELKAKAPRR